MDSPPAPQVDMRTAVPWATQFHARSELLRQLEEQLAADPENIPLRLERAHLLEDLSLPDLATKAYLEILIRDLYNYDAMIRLGTLYVHAGNLDYAHAVFAEAAKQHADRSTPHAYLANVLLDAGDVPGAQAAYDAALRVDPTDRIAHRGLAIIHERAGRFAEAEAAWRRGFPDGSLAISQFRGPGEPVRVLLLSSAIGGNIPLHYVLDDQVFQWTTLIAESYADDMTLPPHAVVFNSIGDADRCGRALENAERALARTDAEVINMPASVRASGRASNAARLAQVAGVVAPRMVAFARAELAAADAVERLAAAGFAFPVLLRTPGYHTGEHFVRVDEAAALAENVAALPGDEILAIAYVDTQRADGTFRKYRVMFVDGRAYPLHLAISREWKVHYFSAAMADDAAFRDEERAFLTDMPAALGRDAIATLERVAGALGLDYGGVDFAFDRDGRLVVFEANATMVILQPDAGELWAYRRGPVETVLAAVRAMIIRRANLAAARAESGTASS